MLEVITDFRILMSYVKLLNDAKRTGDKVKIHEAQVKHDAYRDLCLKSDKMTLGIRYSDLY